MEFYETRGGHDFYYGTVPAIKKALEEQKKALEVQNGLLEEQNKKLENLAYVMQEICDAIRWLRT